jgi:hypothetical protein
MFNLYYFVDYKPDLANGEPEPYTIAFDIVAGESICGEAYMLGGKFLTMDEAVEAVNNTSSKWIFYPNACITESVGKKELLVGIYLADGRNFELSDPEYRSLKQEAQLVTL